MKMLFASYQHDKGFGNIRTEAGKIETSDDIKSLEEFIEMETNFKNVVVINWRRME